MARMIHVEVTAEDIRHGQPFNCSACPLALAISRAFRRESIPLRVEVGFATISLLTLDRKLLSCEVADELISGFQRRFDEGFYVEPFAFDLEIPEVANG